MQPLDPHQALLQQLTRLVLENQPAATAPAAPLQDVGERIHSGYSRLNRDMQDRSTKLKEYYKLHVETSKTSILQGCQGLSGHALVVGIGNGNDIPLEALCRQFEKVTVQEIDEEALSRALKTVPETLRGKIEIVKGDLTGCIEDFVQFLKIKGKIPQTEFIRAACQFFNSAMPKRLEQLPKQKFDYVISAQVSTQLASCLLVIFNDFLKTEYSNDCSDNALTQACSTFSVRSINQHLQDLAFWVKPQGKVYFSDTMEELPLVRPRPDAMPVPSGEKLPMISQEALGAGLKGYQNQLDFIQEWAWYAFVPANYANARGSVFQVRAMVMIPEPQTPSNVQAH